MSVVNGAPLDYSYSPSGSTIELIDLASVPQSSRPSLRISSAGLGLSWHPKLTLYRLLVILSTVGLAAAKTATSYLNLTSASITLEWILGVAVFLFFHLLGAYEETNNPYFSWLFNFDCMEYLWACLRQLVGFNRPYYISDEIDTRHRVGTPPLLTGYRIIVTLVVAIIGMSKSALLYGHKPTEATAIECVFGVGVVTMLYYVGLYEASSLKVYPKLFHVDYSSALYYSASITSYFIGFNLSFVQLQRLHSLLLWRPLWCSSTYSVSSFAVEYPMAFIYSLQGPFPPKWQRKWRGQK
ncbi:hypothetical protein M413DRAFT_166659 [Hebeloma cylindrosporum]|uniref:Uncharacterized protein n=1 Tax=Hebeloma cylindrosporum TaxID=76867 RepID=A0A0C3CAV4_HEBCY|nr:hypothetical protein M413DRAFT_166659 [Hebeloma cylindrosporum h7]